MKSSKAEIRATFHKIPRLRFQPGQKFTSYSGLVIFQALFAKMALKDRLRRCVSSGRKHLSYRATSCLMAVLLLLLLGFRRFRGLDYCREDPMLTRLLGLRRLPDVSTVSRHLARLDQRELSELREHCIRQPVLERLAAEGFARVTLDFDA